MDSQPQSQHRATWSKALAHLVHGGLSARSAPLPNLRMVGLQTMVCGNSLALARNDTSPTPYSRGALETMNTTAHHTNFITSEQLSNDPPSQTPCYGLPMSRQGQRGTPLAFAHPRKTKDTCGRPVGLGIDDREQVRQDTHFHQWQWTRKGGNMNRFEARGKPLRVS